MPPANPAAWRAERPWYTTTAPTIEMIVGAVVVYQGRSAPTIEMIATTTMSSMRVKPLRARKGFTLIELMVVVAIISIVGAERPWYTTTAPTIISIVGAVVVYQGRSARQAAGFAGGIYDLALRLSGLHARAMADA